MLARGDRISARGALKHLQDVRSPSSLTNRRFAQPQAGTKRPRGSWAALNVGLDEAGVARQMLMGALDSGEARGGRSAGREHGGVGGIGPSCWL
jgi:hypothetical protein